MSTKTDKAADYGEPWTCEPDGNGIIIYARNDTVYGIQDSFAWDEIYARRAVQCVNACAGMADPAAEFAAMREAIQEAHAALLQLSECRIFCADSMDIDNYVTDDCDSALAKLQPFIK